MGIISRQPGAPYQDGETLAGADLEGDFATIYDEFNGNVDTANIADDAITTAKILDGSVTQAKLDGTLVATVADDSVSTAKIQALAVTEAKIAANAVTYSKILLGSCVGRSVAFSHSTVNLTTSFTTVAYKGNYLTGAVPGPIIIMVSCNVTTGTSTGVVTVTYQLLKDATSILGAGNTESESQSISSAVTSFKQSHFTRIYVDPTPAASTFISYYFQAKYSTTGSSSSASMADVSFVVLELVR